MSGRAFEENLAALNRLRAEKATTVGAEAPEALDAAKLL
jgi:hypothetical protein